MSSFEEELAEYNLKVEESQGKIKHLEYRLSIEKMSLDKLLHNKLTESKFQSFLRLKDGWLSFRCLKCGNRSKGKTHASKYCEDCNRKAKGDYF